jgi:hypothetical protein
MRRKGCPYDLTTPDGWLSARIVGAVAARSPRTAAGACGAPISSWPSRVSPPANWGRGVRCDGELELVREAAGRVLAGQGLITAVTVPSSGDASAWQR